MTEAIEVLTRKRNSLEAARKSTFDAGADEAFVRGLRAGLSIAVQSLDDEIRWMEQYEASKSVDVADMEQVA